MIAGFQDVLTGINPSTQLYNYFVTEGRYIEEKNVKFEKKMFGHTFPTDINECGNIDCSESRGPYIGKCGYDGAGAILNHIYGNLKPRVGRNQRTGSLIKFDQSEFLSNPHSYGLDTTGYAYVPKACSKNQKCRLHIVFQGCFMSYFYTGLQFVENTGYDLWADSNNIILVFPQTNIDLTTHKAVSNETFINSIACWDYFGLYDNMYNTKQGVQIKFIKSIIDRISNI